MRGCCAVWLIFLLWSGSLSVYPLKVMFYNVENLFDCENDSLTQDDEFTPTGVKRWHFGRFRDKVGKISRVIVCASVPDLVGLCEVEGEKVIQYLTRYGPLKTRRYNYVVTHSTDPRGMNVALLYQRDKFKYLHHRSFNPSLSDNDRKPTRDILYVCGMTSAKDTIDLFIVHFPSRASGEIRSAPYRNHVADILRSKADSIMAIRTNPYILIMGDFNDAPSDPSLIRHLKAKPISKEPQERELYNLSYPLLSSKDRIGTYKFKGEWILFDQFIVNGSFLSSHSQWEVSNRTAEIFHPDFLSTEDSLFDGKEPFRTYKGWKYQGGYSDHYPVCLEIVNRF